MKLFTFLLGVYMLLLPLMPCGDSEECNEESKQELVAGVNHDQHEEEEETCTPFCYCTCCHVSVFAQQLPPEFSQWINMSSLNTAYSTSFYSFDLHNIWQPPKIG